MRSSKKLVWSVFGGRSWMFCIRQPCQHSFLAGVLAAVAGWKCKWGELPSPGQAGIFCPAWMMAKLQPR